MLINLSIFFIEFISFRSARLYQDPIPKSFSVCSKILIFVSSSLVHHLISEILDIVIENQPFWLVFSIHSNSLCSSRVIFFRNRTSSFVSI